jgi:hypothetical protein
MAKFSSTNQPEKNGRHKGRTATDWLRTLSHTNIKFHNPLTDKTEIGEVNLVVAIQLILKATQDSDLPSIKEYFERLDGKIANKTELSGKIDNQQTKIIIINGKSERDNASRLPEKISI